MIIVKGDVRNGLRWVRVTHVHQIPAPNMDKNCRGEKLVIWITLICVERCMDSHDTEAAENSQIIETAIGIEIMEFLSWEFLSLIRMDSANIFVLDNRTKSGCLLGSLHVCVFTNSLQASLPKKRKTF